MLGLQHVDRNGRVLAGLLIAEVAVIVVYSFADLANPAGGTITFATLDPAALFTPGVGAILALPRRAGVRRVRRRGRVYPVVNLFFWGGTTGGLGILALIATTAVAVVVYFLRHPDHDTTGHPVAAAVWFP